MVKFRTEKKIVPIDKIRPNRWNPNYMEKFMFDKAKKSIREIGFLGSILVRNHEVETYYEILDGEHRWKALKEEGATECPVEVIIGEMSEDEAKLLTILINNLRGKDDIFKRAKILEALNEGQLSLLPMTVEEIEHEKRFVQWDFDQYTKDTGEETENEFAHVVVLPLNKEQAEIWTKAKELLMEKNIIKEKAKKKQDIAVVMLLIKEFFNLAIGVNEEDKIEVEI